MKGCFVQPGRKPSVGVSACGAWSSLRFRGIGTNQAKKLNVQINRQSARSISSDPLSIYHHNPNRLLSVASAIALHRLQRSLPSATSAVRILSSHPANSAVTCGGPNPSLASLLSLRYQRCHTPKNLSACHFARGIREGYDIARLPFTPTSGVSAETTRSPTAMASRTRAGKANGITKGVNGDQTVIATPQSKENIFLFIPNLIGT